MTGHRLFYIRHDDVANNAALFTIAMDASQALDQWRYHYGLPADAIPDAVYAVPVALDSCIPGPIAWGHMPNLLKHISTPMENQNV
jgi:hypothetical protein